MNILNLIEIKVLLSKSRAGQVVIVFYRYIIAFPFFWVKALSFYLIKNKVVSPKFYEDEKLFDLISDDRKSIARFGDGEIQWIFNDAKGYFGQLNNQELSTDLLDVIKSEDQSLIVCVPRFFSNMNDYSWKRVFSRNAHLFSNYSRWNLVLSDENTYGDALITRVYNGREDLNKIRFIFDKWKSVFENRDVVVIEGKDTKFGVGNDLLNKSKTIRRIIGPSENAFERKLDLLAAARKLYDRDVLFIICLGPTATVLASSICLDGFQAIDIGHLDVEYEWYLRGCKRKLPIPGKYVNEAGGAPSSMLKDEYLVKYQSEVCAELEVGGGST